MTIDDLIEEIKFIVSDGNVLRLDANQAERLLYWLTEYSAMVSGRQSDSLSERLTSHLVWAESNSYECPVTLAEDLQEAIKRLQGVSSWHSCDDKPPERITYLVSDGYCVYFGFYDVFKHKWVCNEDTDGNSLRYWMEIPKPQPPKEVT